MSKSIIEKLSDWGCDTKGALCRLINDEDFYISCLRDMSSELGDLSELSKAIDSGDSKHAFEIVHYHKGPLGSLGLTPIYDPICEITEVLRNGTVDGAMPLLEKIIANVTTMNEIIGIDTDE